MIARKRASLGAALVLLVACSASGAAQHRECSAADSARVGWSPPPGVADETWRATLVAEGLVAPETRLVRIAHDSLPSLGVGTPDLFFELDRVIRERSGDGPVKVVILARVEADSTLSRLLLALPSGMIGIEQSIGETIRRVRFSPAFRDGCPMAIWHPITVQVSPTRRIGASESQAPPRGGAESEWVNLVTIRRLRDEFADRPHEANYGDSHDQPWALLDRPVVLPEPFHSRPLVAESFVLLDVDSAGRAAGCRPLRAGAHPELDGFACTLLMRPGYFAATLLPPRESVAGRWVMGLRWQSLTTAAHRERRATLRGGGVAGPVLSQPPGDRWVRVHQWVEGGVDWIDTTSVSRVREEVFRFTLRYSAPHGLTRVSDGLTYNGNEVQMEFDCARGRYRHLAEKSLLGERVVEEVVIPRAQSWSGTIPRLRDAYCPVLRQVRPPSPSTPPND